MKLGEECVDMPPLLDFLLKEGFLQLEVILLAQKSCHATASILKRANGSAFCTHALHVEAVFLECLSEAFCLASLSGHALCLAAELGAQIIQQNHSILLFSLFAPV